jgi:hypothetical protein
MKDPGLQAEVGLIILVTATGWHAKVSWGPSAGSCVQILQSDEFGKILLSDSPLTNHECSF